MRIVLIDDHALLREGFQHLLGTNGDIHIVGVAETAEQGLAVVRANQPDLVLVELRLSTGDAVPLLVTLHQECPARRVVVLTHSDDDEDLVRALRAGADGFISKSRSASALVAGLLAVMRGEVALSRTLTSRLVDHLRREGRHEPPRSQSLPLSTPLSPRELEVLRGIAVGASNKQIARRLGVSEHTVRTHVTNVLVKLQLSSRLQVAAYALRHGLTVPEPTDPVNR